MVGPCVDQDTINYAVGRRYGLPSDLTERDRAYANRTRYPNACMFEAALEGSNTWVEAALGGSNTCSRLPWRGRTTVR